LTADDQPKRSQHHVVVLGDGGWGTAIALTLSNSVEDVRLWSYDPEYAKLMRETRRNPKYLPGVKLPPNLRISSNVEDIMADVDAIFSVIPSQYLRQTLDGLALDVKARVPVVSCSKGVEKRTLALPSDILKQRFPGRDIIIFSGPSHAEEVAHQLPTTVVAAADNIDQAIFVQNLFENTRLRVYTSRDRRGVELGGAVKNVVAIAAGISDGLGFGDNSRAAIVCRGLVEITRLGIALGARRETFSGLSGMGDLITTCTSPHSRNRGVGLRVGKGERLADILRSTEMVAEGVETSRSVHELKHQVGVEMPIAEEVYQVVHEGKNPEEAVSTLMSRAVKEEIEDLI